MNQDGPLKPSSGDPDDEGHAVLQLRASGLQCEGQVGQNDILWIC